jgi:pSer/pThr/pTyr-binding forkhead associated (FHA) protein/CheY-like chemotaxis protein
MHGIECRRLDVDPPALASVSRRNVVPAFDGPDLSRSGTRERRDSSGSLRVLYVEDAEGAADFSWLDQNVELVRETSWRVALARLESDEDFSVVVCDERVGGADGLELLERARALSPTTVRLLIGDTAGPGATRTPCEEAFRCIPRSNAGDELQQAILDALDYHQLLATSPVQPVELARSERDAMPPPANPQHNAARLQPGIDRGPVRITPGPDSSDLPARGLLNLGAALRRVGLQVGGRFVELLPGLTVVGRSRTCHIPIPDPQISRRHAAFSNDGRDVLVRNVSQTNSLRVNGISIERDAARSLVVGDRVTLGGLEIELCALGDYCPSIEPTDIVLRDVAPEHPSRSTLLTLAQVATKYFVLGQAREAERILRPVLDGLLRHCAAGQKPSNQDMELATDLTLRIVEASHAGEWIDYLFQLFTRLERPMPPEVIERLYRVIPDSQGAKMNCYRGYLDTLERLGDRLGPQERFLVRRIHGLATPLRMSAHV